MRIRDERWRVVRCDAHDATALVDVAGADRSNRGTAARFLLPFESVERLPAAQRLRWVKPDRWRRAVGRMLGEATPGWSALRTASRAAFTILPFQLEPAIAMLEGDACRFLIADAVGMGKTIQAGLMIAELLDRWPDARALILTPAGLRAQWHEELTSRFRLAPAIFDAAHAARVGAAIPSGINPWAVAPIAIVSIDYVKRPEVIRGLESIVWDIVVIDEAHAAAGASDRAIAASVLASRARIVVALTATPHSGDADAFARLCALGALDHDERVAVFQRTREHSGSTHDRRTMVLRVRPTATERAMHAALMEYATRAWTVATESGERGGRLVATLLARRACSSASSLVRSVERRLALLADLPAAPQLPLPFAVDDDGDFDAVLAAPALANRGEEHAHLEWILTLAREAARAESKLAALARLLHRANEPAIVFTEFRDTLAELARALGDIPHTILHGGLTDRERAEALRRFVTGSARLLLATDAASEGLNLHQRCRLVITLELPWMPTRLEQRVGRVDRIGQLRRVHAVHLVAGGTSEERVQALLQSRQARIRSAAAALHRPLEESAVAAAVFDGEAADPASVELPPSVVVVNRRRDAMQEAGRLAVARRLLDASRGVESRPVATVLRRGAPVLARGPLWGWRVLLLDASDRMLLDTILGTIADDEVAAREAAAEHAMRLAAALRQSLDAPSTRWQQREQLLLARLVHEHGRLAAHLLQGRLFDRRHERELAEQRLRLDDVREQSRIRLDRLTASASPTAAPCELAFAVRAG